MSPLLTGLLLLLGLGFFGYTMQGRLRVLFKLKPAQRFDHLAERFRRLLLFGFGQKRMVDPEERAPGTMHLLIFFAFMVLTVRTVSLFAMGFSSGALRLFSTLEDPFWKAHGGLAALYGGYLLLKDLFAGLALVGVGYFAWLRLRVKPARLTVSREALLILGFIGGLMVSEFVFGASHLVAQGRPFTAVEPVTSLVALLLQPLAGTPLHVLGVIAFWIHLAIVVTFLNFLPYGKHFHVITGLPNVFVQRLTGSAALPTPDLEKEEFGTRSVGDLHWKQGLDLYSCTECGRCQTHCPTYITGKPLTHKGVNQDLKHWIWDHQSEVISKPSADLPPIVDTILKPETVWA
jgi:ferredoxin